MAGIVARMRKIQPILVVISLVVGLIAAAITYFIYQPIIEQFKLYANILPSYMIEVLPVESWWVLPIAAALFWYLIVSFATYWLLKLIIYLRKIYSKSNPN